MTQMECYTVYVHTNKCNDKKYVGVTTCTLKARFKKGGLGYRNNKLMWADIEKYGWDSFDHEVIGRNLPPDVAYDIEVSLIAKYKSNNPKYGYNVYPGGYRVPSGAGNAMSKSVVCSRGGAQVTYGSIRECSREIGESLYQIRKSIRDGIPTPGGYTLSL